MFFFFFSSRRRHTRYIGDWSSDVCSSDLSARPNFVLIEPPLVVVPADAVMKFGRADILSLEIASEAKEIGRATCRESLSSSRTIAQKKSERLMSSVSGGYLYSSTSVLSNT